MINFYYICPIALLIISLLSVSQARTASLIMIFWQGVNLLLMGVLVSLASVSNMTGAFFALILSMIITCFCVGFYRSEGHRILLSLSVVASAFAAVHLLYIASFIEVFVKSHWYGMLGLEFFYRQYANLQIVLTLYMISLFWRSGKKGLSNGLDRIFKFEKPSSNLGDVPFVLGSVANNRSLDSKNKNNKKGAL